MIQDYLASEYLIALVVFVGLSLFFRIVLYISQRVLLFATRKTKTKLDDILIERLSNPLTYLAIIASLAVAIEFLTLTSTVEFIVSNLVYSVIVFIVARVIYLIVNIIVLTSLRNVAKKSEVKFDDTLFNMFSSLLNSTLVIVSLLYLLSIWGIEIGPLLAGLGIAGLAVALALQPILSNIFSGASVILDQSIKVGDLIYLEGASIKGRIDRIGLRATRIRTFDNEYIIVPNNKIAESHIQNIGLPEPKSRVVIPFGVAYGSDIDKVKKLVIKEIKKIKNLDSDEKPVVRFIEMADSSLNFKAYFYVKSFENRFAAIDDANTRIYNALNKAKIEIPFPQMDVHVKK